VPDVSHAEPRPAEEIEAWKQRDPIKLFGERLLDEEILSPDDIQRIEREVAAETEEAEQFAMESPMPDPAILDKALYAD
jgi:pyruvate dehydrogenase E1 component alpha subunit